MRKYTKVHGCIGGKNEIYKSARRTRKVHKGAIRAKPNAKRCWVGVDEWTDEQGHAIANVLIGAGPKIFLAATLQLQCKGQNQGVEHSESGNEVINVLNNMGVPLKKVIAFVSDSAAVLKKVKMQS